MAKKPSISFYTSDFITQTMFLSFEEKGKLIMLYCLQHQHGHLSKEQMESVCGNLSTSILNFFQLDAEGKYFNEQIENSMIERDNFIKRQKEKSNKRWKKDATEYPTEYPTEHSVGMPLEDEDEKEEEIEDVKENDKKGNKVVRKKGKIFVKPTKEEVLQYAKEQKLRTDCIDDFIDHYESNGWRVGKAGLPMKSWEASYRKWCRSDYNQPKNKGNPFLEMLKKEYPEEANNIFPDNVVDTEGVEQ